MERTHRRFSTPRLAIVAVTAAVCCFSAAFGEWKISPKDVPVERLLENARAYLRRRPDDGQGHYVLGRLHSMAFALGKDQLTVASAPGPLDRTLPTFVPWESVLSKRTGGAPKVLTGKQLVHLEASIRNYRQAVDLWSAVPKEKPKTEPEKPKEGDKEKASAEPAAVARAMLGQAWMLEEAATLQDAFAKGVASEDFKKLDKGDREAVAKLAADSRDWQAQSLEGYRGVYRLMADKDKRRGFAGPQADTLMSADAATAIVRILGARKTNFDEREEIGQMKAHLGHVAAIGRVVTPIIFPALSPQPLDRLLDAGKVVDFDLAADGLGRRWPWLRSDACLLVWDPQGTGQVRDGRQLFGSVTWWIFWDDGYQPLAALDDDGDGYLAGKELAGLAAWQDRNGNGRSDTGEVVPIGQRGIRRIAAHSQGREQGVPANARGIELESGAWLPTYDWTPVSVPNDKRRAEQASAKQRRCVAAWLGLSVLKPSGVVEIARWLALRLGLRYAQTQPPHDCLMASFPTQRLRRLRYHPGVRRLVRKTSLSPSNLILPLFVRSGKNVRQEIASMPGHFQLSVDQLIAEAHEARRARPGRRSSSSASPTKRTPPAATRATTRASSSKPCER